MRTEQVKLEEEQFISRLWENLAIVENTGGIQESDNMAELRKLTGGKLLRSELEARYPLGKSLSMRITPKSARYRILRRPASCGDTRRALSIKHRASEQLPIILNGKLIIRLDRFVEKGGDEEPILLAELHSILTKESDLANRNRYESIFGLYSPTGWAVDANRFIENEPPGSGWASKTVYPVLIGPEITELVWDKKSNKLRQYVQCFCGLTLEERSRICKDEIQKAMLVQDFANLQKIAEAKSFGLDFVKKVAKEITSDSKELVLSKVPGVGFVLKKKM